MSYEKIKEIELVLENCETVIIPREAIGDLLFSDYSREFSRQAMNWIGVHESYGFVLLEIHRSLKDMDTLGSTFGGAFNSEYSGYDRLLHGNDITGIYVTYEDELKEQSFSFHPVWEGESDYSNSAQTVTQNDKGDLLIIIASEKARLEYKNIIEEYQELFNDDDDFKWEMYSISELKRDDE